MNLAIIQDEYLILQVRKWRPKEAGWLIQETPSLKARVEMALKTILLDLPQTVNKWCK